MTKNLRRKTIQRNKKVPWVIFIIVAIVATISVLIFWQPRFSGLTIFQIPLRAINTVAYYAFNKKPHFYYAVMEKNGKEIHVSPSDTFDITYRDEFVIKSVESDDLKGENIHAAIEGMGNEGNHLGLMFRGIDFVNRVMKSDEMAKGVSSVDTYRISIYFKNEKIADVPIRVLITAQDWLRFAKETPNTKVQIEYLKKAIAQNSSDAGVRKILAGIYLKQERIQEAVDLYEEILRIKPDDISTLKELARCYLKSHQIMRAIEHLSSVLRIQPKDAEACGLLGLAYGEKNMWDKAVEQYRQAVELDPENNDLRYLLAQALQKAGKTTAAVRSVQISFRPFKRFHTGFAGNGRCLSEKKEL